MDKRQYDDLMALNQDVRPDFQRRHYEQIARIISESMLPDVDNLTVSMDRAITSQMNALVDNFCVMFAKDNRNFSVAKFREACYRIR